MQNLGVKVFKAIVKEGFLLDISLPIGEAKQEGAGKCTLQYSDIAWPEQQKADCFQTVASINLVPTLCSFQHLKGSPRTTKPFFSPESQEVFAVIVIFLSTCSGESNQIVTSLILCS